MADKESKLNKVLEGFRPMPMGRMFYPRNMKLSEDFINAFHREYDRLVSEGQGSKSLLERFSKALKFHVGATRKYHVLDEEKTGHDCKKVHPGKTHEEWEEMKAEKDRNSASEGPHSGG